MLFACSARSRITNVISLAIWKERKRLGKVKCEKGGRPRDVQGEEQDLQDGYHLLLAALLSPYYDDQLPHKQTCIVLPLYIGYDYCELQRSSLLFNNGA